MKLYTTCQYMETQPDRPQYWEVVGCKQTFLTTWNNPGKGAISELVEYFREALEYDNTVNR